MSATEGEAEDFNILEYADPDLDTGDETVTGSRKNLLEEHLALADEVSKKEAEENAAKVAQGVSEFQAKLLEFTEKQQNIAVILHLPFPPLAPPPSLFISCIFCSDKSFILFYLKKKKFFSINSK